jgi:hypothetical protein
MQHDMIRRGDAEIGRRRGSHTSRCVTRIMDANARRRRFPPLTTVNLYAGIARRKICLTTARDDE